MRSGVWIGALALVICACGESDKGGGGGSGGSASGACTTHGDCKEPAPLCDVKSGSCVECLDGGACASGTCLPDGRCATAQGEGGCTAFPDSCDEGMQCMTFTAGKTDCVPAGKIAVGATCPDNGSSPDTLCARDSLCVNYGGGQSRCTKRCGGDEDCPDGIHCMDAEPAGTRICPAGAGQGGGDECTVFPDSCTEGKQCFSLSLGFTSCLPEGKIPVGSACPRSPASDPAQLCGRNAACVAYSETDNKCTQVCVSDDDCPGEKHCLPTQDPTMKICEL